jgi:hypothetical protein
MEVQFNATIALECANHFNFINAIASTPSSPCHAAPWLKEWETWQILKYGELHSTANVKFGDVIGLKNNQFTVYMSGGSAASAQLTTVPALQAPERWRLVKANEAVTAEYITTADEFYIQSADTGAYCSVPGGNNQNTVYLVREQGRASRFRIILTHVIR